jgi:uncharacterized membrane protein YfcA
VSGAAALVAAAAVAAGASAQAVTGIGFALVCAPFLVAVVGAGDGVRLAVTLSAVLNVALLAREWRAVRLRGAALLSLGALPAAPLVALGLRRVGHGEAEVAAAVAILLAVAVVASGRRLPGGGSPAVAVVAGVCSAAMNVVAAVGGPAAAVFATGSGWGVQATRATLQGYFLLLNIVTLATLGLPPLTLWPAYVGLAVGVAAGALLSGRVPDRAARQATLLLAAGAGLALLARATLGS